MEAAAARSQMGSGAVEGRLVPAWSEPAPGARIVRSTIPDVSHGYLILDENRAEWRIGGLLSSAYTCPSPLIDATWCIFPYLEPRPRPWLALLCAGAQLSLYSLDSEEHRVPLPHGYTTVFPTPLGLLLLGDKEAHPPLLLEHPLDVPRTVLVPGTGHDILWATHECHWIVTSDAQAGTVTPLGCRGAWEVFMGMSWLELCGS
ncbi:hypothetical protein ACKKBF_B33485 [Auxenochlorella protothecoides x Auxenochlorella symbiontica]